MTFALITGIPRSGTTFAGALLDEDDDTFFLSEPDEHVTLMEQASSEDQFVEELAASMRRTHSALQRGESVLNRRAPDGSSITNYFGSGPSSREATFAVVPVQKAHLRPDFTLCAKHNALYTSVLPQLVRSRHFKIMALVRAPVAVIASWQSLELPISHGRLPAGERFWPELRDLGTSDQPLIQKQIHIFELLCRRYLEFRSEITLVRYEDMVRNPVIVGNCFGKALPNEVAEKLRPLSATSPSPGTTGIILDNLRTVADRGHLRATLQLYPNLE